MNQKGWMLDFCAFLRGLPSYFSLPHLFIFFFFFPKLALVLVYYLLIFPVSYSLLVNNFFLKLKKM